MSYTELEHGYQGLKKARPAFYFGDSSVRVNHRVSELFSIFAYAVVLLP